MLKGESWAPSLFFSFKAAAGWLAVSHDETSIYQLPSVAQFDLLPGVELQQ